MLKKLSKNSGGKTDIKCAEPGVGVVKTAV